MKRYTAAWLDKDSEKMLSLFGITKKVHLTTFFDAGSKLHTIDKYNWSGIKTATITKVSLWPVGDTHYLVAEVNAPWSLEINTHYLAQGGIEDLTHRPHITLMKNPGKDDLEHLQLLVSVKLVFNSHL